MQKLPKNSPIMILSPSVQLLSHVRLFVTPWTAARHASLFITNSQSLLKLMSIESVMPSNHLILRRPLLLPPSQSFPASGSFLMSQLFLLGTCKKYIFLHPLHLDWCYVMEVTFTTLTHVHGTASCDLPHPLLISWLKTDNTAVRSEEEKVMDGGNGIPQSRNGKLPATQTVIWARRKLWTGEVPKILKVIIYLALIPLINTVPWKSENPSWGQK